MNKNSILDIIIAIAVISLLVIVGNAFAKYVTIQNKINEIENIKNNTIDLSNVKYIYIKNKSYVLTGDTLILK